MQSKWIYSGEATVGLSVHDNELAVEFCDARVAQWKEPAGPLTDWEDDDELRRMVAESICDNADDLAQTIVLSLRKQIELRDENHGE